MPATLAAFECPSENIDQRPHLPLVKSAPPVGRALPQQLRCCRLTEFRTAPIVWAVHSVTVGETLFLIGLRRQPHQHGKVGEISALILHAQQRLSQQVFNRRCERKGTALRHDPLEVRQPTGVSGTTLCALRHMRRLRRPDQLERLVAAPYTSRCVSCQTQFEQCRGTRQ
jgi:hypothetical protein